MIDEAILQDLIGVPFLDRGRDVGEGVDCYGLVRAVMHRLYGLELPDYLGTYASAVESEEVALAIDMGLARWRALEIPEPGDVVRFWATDPACPCHLGVYLGRQRILTTSHGKGAHIAPLAGEFWQRRLVGSYRHESRYDGFRAVWIDGFAPEDRREHRYTGRVSLADVIGDLVGSDGDRERLRVLVGRSAYDDPAAWDRIYPRPGTVVTVRRVDAAAAIPYLIAIAISVVLSAASYYIQRALTPTDKPPDDDDTLRGPTASPTLRGTPNSIRPYQPIAVGYGDLVVYPALGAPLFTYFIGRERWAAALYVIGEGRYEIPEDEIEIGGVPITDIAGASWRIGEGGLFATYAEETIQYLAVASRPAGYWKLEDNSNEIAGGAVMTAAAGATYNATPIIVDVGGGSGATANVGYFAAFDWIVDWDSDWTIDLWATADYTISHNEYLVSVGTTNPIEIYKLPGRAGIAVRVGADTYGSYSDTGAFRGVGIWGTTDPDSGVDSPTETAHLVVKYSAPTGRLVVQINGVVQRFSARSNSGQLYYYDGEPISITAPSGTERVVLGASASLAGATRWTDRIDEVAIWPRYLTDSEGGQRTQSGARGTGATREPRFDQYRDSVYEVTVGERFETNESSVDIGHVSLFVTREVPGAQNTELSADLWFDGLYRRNRDNDKKPVVVGIILQYRPSGTTDWLNSFEAQGFASSGEGRFGANAYRGADGVERRGLIQVSGYTQDSFPMAFRWDVPPGSYEMRLAKVELEKSSNRPGSEDAPVAVHGFTLLVFRGTALGRSPLNVAGLATVAMNVPLSSVGNQIGQVSVRRRRLLPIYDPLDADADPVTGFTPPRATRSAAWAALDILRSAPRPVDDSLLALDEFADWATRAADFDFEFDFATNKFEAFRIAGEGSRAELDVNASGLYGVSEDRVQTTPVQLLTARNVVNFSGVKFFRERPHALLVDWRDERGNQKQMTVYDDGYSADGTEPGTVAATQFQTFRVQGLIDAQAVWEFARIELRMHRLRDEEWHHQVALDALPLRRLERIEEQHPAMLVGRKAGRVIRVDTSGGNTTAVRIDEKIVYNAGESYGIRWRDAANSQNLTTVTNPAVGSPIESDVLTLTAPLPIASAPALDALIAFGLVGQETVSSIVREISWQDEWTANVITVPYIADIFAPGEMPVDVDPVQTPRPDLPIAQSPATPKIARIESDERWILRVGHSLITRVRITLKQSGNTRIAAYRYQVRWAAADSPVGWTSSPTFDVDNPVCFVDGLTDGDLYEFQARAYSAIGTTSPWSASVIHRVVGKSTPPPNITDVRVQNGLIVWRYASESIVDFAGFRVRYRYGNTLPVLWGRGIAAHTGLVGTNQFPIDALPRGAGPLTVMIKAVDVAGNESVEPGRVIIGLGNATPIANVVIARDEMLAGWPGEKIDGTVVSTDLVADTVAIPWAWSKVVIGGDRSNVSGSFLFGTPTDSVAITAGPAVLADAQPGYYLWLDSDGAEAATQIAYTVAPSTIYLTEPYRGVGSSGAGKIHKAAYAASSPSGTVSETSPYRAGAWTGDPAQKAWEQRYRAMLYTATLLPDGLDLGDRITLSVLATLRAYELLYNDGATPAWQRGDANPAWDLAGDAWVAVDDFIPWPGELAIARRVVIKFRVAFDEIRATTAPKLSSMVIAADVPDRIERIEDFKIEATGSRVYVDTPFRVIKTVTVTLQQAWDAGSSNAIQVRVVDKNVSGPLLTAHTGTGALTAAFVDVVIVGA